ncbi:hypothetical protein Q8W71_19995 [Methylobacterium sp. NEAU 140]|uniref:hypothetical protein n=1 Tax=Methylobacterium sp. NEAU 140 TaxID=3064945 RepID=UPI0027364F5A|nr:hypothetical protein [Methylobacterium sp. NEAU 140]MDP4024917.1 hypothetical protein [Methylobacterium sp. NEAU 140]
MNKNRFERVDEPVDDAMTLSLKREGEKCYGVLSCPASAAPGHLPRDFRSDEMPLEPAIRSAVRLANEWKVALVVQDPDDLWQPDWGTLYREDDADPSDP